MKKTNVKLAAVALVVILTGCASTTTKNKISTIESLDLAYGRVIKVFEADTAGNRSYCDRLKSDAASTAVCANLKSYEVAKSAIFNSGRVFTYGVVVPKSEHVVVGNYIEFNPTRRFAAFSGVVARADTESCKWVGPTPEGLNSGPAMAAGFLAGMLIVPGAILLADDSILEGGVECNGWSYKASLTKALSAN